MNLEQLEELVRGQPFEPFTVVMANGERLLVPHEDFIWIMPNRRLIQIALPNGASRWVNLQLVAGLEKPFTVAKTDGGKHKRRGCSDSARQRLQAFNSSHHGVQTRFAKFHENLSPKA